MDINQALKRSLLDSYGLSVSAASLRLVIRCLKWSRSRKPFVFNEPELALVERTTKRGRGIRPVLGLALHWLLGMANTLVNALGTA